MTHYVHQTNNLIDVTPRNLPTAWGRTSGLQHATPEELKALGWLPVTYENTEFDPDIQMRTGPSGVGIGDSVTPGADGVTAIYTVTAKSDPELAALASRECERRLRLGRILTGATVSPGTRFKCDDAAVTRLGALLRTAEIMEAAAQPFSKTFMTDSGVEVTVDSAAEVRAIYLEVVAYAGDLLESSAGLQGDPPTDPRNDLYWPSDGSA